MTFTGVILLFFDVTFFFIVWLSSKEKPTIPHHCKLISVQHAISVDIAELPHLQTSHHSHEK